jgi:membrane-associated phospholipid phosphatase
MPDQISHSISFDRASDRGMATWLGVTSLLVILGFASLVVDIPMARWAATDGVPEVIEDVVARTEAFAHGVGIVIVLLAVAVLDPRRRWALPRIILGVAGAGLLVNSLKLLVCRTRPQWLDLTDPAVQSFKGWLPLFTVGSTDRSTPSAHTAAVIALAVVLSWLYPRGRWLFGSIAFLGAFERIVVGAHFTSDVFWGAATGWFVARGFIAGHLTKSRFDRLEARLAARCHAKAVERDDIASPVPLVVLKSKAA